MSKIGRHILEEQIINIEAMFDKKITKQRSLNELRQEKEFGYKPPLPKPLEWTDKDMLTFARIASEGAYGRYRGCKSLESKLLRYKQLK